MALGVVVSGAVNLAVVGTGMEMLLGRMVGEGGRREGGLEGGGGGMERKGGMEEWEKMGVWVRAGSRGSQV